MRPVLRKPISDNAPKFRINISKAFYQISFILSQIFAIKVFTTGQSILALGKRDGIFHRVLCATNNPMLPATKKVTVGANRARLLNL
jgi:hypothetical protein